MFCIGDSSFWNECRHKVSSFLNSAQKSPAIPPAATKNGPLGEVVKHDALHTVIGRCGRSLGYFFQSCKHLMNRCFD